MSKVLDKKMAKLAEKMAKIKNALNELEAQKKQSLNTNSTEIITLATSIQTLAKNSGETVAQVLTLLGRTLGTRKVRVKSSAPVAIKYRDPADAANQWTGRGLPPRWLQAYLDLGRKREDFLVA